eukprot:m.852093 g.852093  ORF g.852093 m.852093 type:complete len:446 (-) comp59595_c0_seq20:470-1807(-)
MLVKLFTSVNSSRVKFSSAAVRAVCITLNADAGQRSNEDILAQLIQSSTTFEELQKLFQAAQTNELMTSNVLRALIDTYLSVTATQAESVQRTAAMWLLRTLKAFKDDKIYLAGPAYLGLVERFIELKFLAATSILFEHLVERPDFRRVLSEPLLLSMLRLCGTRSARDLSESPSEIHQKRLNRVGMGANTRRFFRKVWEELERVSVSSEQQQPSMDAHIVLLDSYSRQADIPGVEFAHKLIKKRFPNNARRKDVCDGLVGAAARAGEVSLAVNYASNYAKGDFDLESTKLLFASIKFTSHYHHTRFILFAFSSSFLLPCFFLLDSPHVRNPLPSIFLELFQHIFIRVFSLGILIWRSASRDEGFFFSFLVSIFYGTILSNWVVLSASPLPPASSWPLQLRLGCRHDCRLSNSNDSFASRRRALISARTLDFRELSRLAWPGLPS